MIHTQTRGVRVQLVLTVHSLEHRYLHFRLVYAFLLVVLRLKRYALDFGFHLRYLRFSVSLRQVDRRFLALKRRKNCFVRFVHLVGRHLGVLNLDVRKHQTYIVRFKLLHRELSYLLLDRGLAVRQHAVHPA